MRCQWKGSFLASAVYRSGREQAAGKKVFARSTWGGPGMAREVFGALGSRRGASFRPIGPRATTGNSDQNTVNAIVVHKQTQLARLF